MEYTDELFENYAKVVSRTPAGEIRIGVGELEAFLREITRLQSEARWIPVSQLPEVKKDTLFLCAIRNEIKGVWSDTRTFWAESKRFSGSSDVTHWMPLPTPPMEGRNAPILFTTND